MPADWRASKELWDYGFQIGLTYEQVNQSLSRLPLYARNKALKSADWDAYARIWLQREREFSKPNGRQNDATGFLHYAAEDRQ